jgi:hypothetical protein
MTGRRLLRRPGYEIDIEKVLRACAKHYVAVEINAHPWRLDLDWRADFSELATLLRCVEFVGDGGLREIDANRPDLPRLLVGACFVSNGFALDDFVALTQSRYMKENVVAAIIRLDEAIALTLIEHFDCALRHSFVSKMDNRA